VLIHVYLVLMLFKYCNW